MVCSYSIFYSKYDDDWATSWIQDFHKKSALHLYIFLVQYTGQVPIFLFYFIILIRFLSYVVHILLFKSLMFNIILVMFMLAENGVWLAFSFLLSGFICILINFDVIYE